MLKRLKTALESRARRKKFEKMKEQLDPKPKPRPAKKCVKRG
jgi:hypothetical protein